MRRYIYRAEYKKSGNDKPKSQLNITLLSRAIYFDLKKFYTKNYINKIYP